MKYTVHTDGGARGNPGPAAIGVVIDDGQQKNTFGKYIGDTTNNHAEYAAVLEAMLFLQRNKERGEVLFLLDSELVVKQLTGVYKIKDSRLKILSEKIKALIYEWESPVFFQHVPREQNREADKIVNNTLDAQQ